eukprot:scaffold208407_cov37-Tisochrysis_lutea.AAC.1
MQRNPPTATIRPAHRVVEPKVAHGDNGGMVRDERAPDARVDALWQREQPCEVGPDVDEVCEEETLDDAVRHAVACPPDQVSEVEAAEEDEVPAVVQFDCVRAPPGARAEWMT